MQRTFLGELHTSEDVDGGDGEAEGDQHDPSAEGDTEAAADAAESASLWRASGSGSESSEDEAMGPAGVGSPRAPHDEKWLEPGGRRVPSLAPPDEVTAAESTALQLTRHATPARAAVAEAGNVATVWGWHGGVRGGSQSADNPIVRLFRRAWALEVAWAPGTPDDMLLRRGWRRVLWRGIRPVELTRVAQGEGLRAST